MNFDFGMKNFYGLRLLVGVMMALVLMSCGTRGSIAKLQPGSMEQITDSTYTLEKIKMRDTLITVAPDSLRMRILLGSLPDSKPVAIQSRSGMEVRVVRVADTLVIDCATQTRELWIALAEKVREIKQLKKHTKTITVPVAFIPWWVKVLAWAGGICIALLAIGGLLKRFRFI